MNQDNVYIGNEHTKALITDAEHVLIERKA
jgi:hypothetical protein